MNTLKNKIGLVLLSINTFLISAQDKSAFDSIDQGATGKTIVNNFLENWIWPLLFLGMIIYFAITLYKNWDRLNGRGDEDEGFWKALWNVFKVFILLSLFLSLIYFSFTQYKNLVSIKV